MTEHPDPPPPLVGLDAAVAVLMAEAESTTARITGLRRELEHAEVRRRKLLTALGSAVEALPGYARDPFTRRIRALAEAARPPRGRKPDSRQQAIIEFLAERAHFDDEVVKVAEVQTHLERLGFRNLPHGYASNALARLAEQGFAVKIRFARYRVNAVHPELVSLRLKMLDGDIETLRARDDEIAEAERRGREGRHPRAL